MFWGCFLLFFQKSTKYTPYCALCGRHPRTPGVINIAQTEGEDISVVVKDVTEQQIEAKTAEVRDLHKKVMVKWLYMHLKFTLKYMNKDD